MPTSPGLSINAIKIKYRYQIVVHVVVTTLYIRGSNQVHTLLMLKNTLYSDHHLVTISSDSDVCDMLVD